MLPSLNHCVQKFQRYAGIMFLGYVCIISSFSLIVVCLTSPIGSNLKHVVLVYFVFFFLLGIVYFVCCEFIFHLVFMWLFSSKEELNSCILQHLGESPLPAYEPVFDWENERSMIFGQRIPEAHIAQYGRFGQLS